ncbi:MAG: virulence RhuM family protein [Bacteroidia bacterium]|nr:virulence RhuM family protein [Bacteroidia bacterium]
MESEILIYQTGDGSTKIEVRLENEDVWLSQTQMGILYQKSKSSISEHIKEIFRDGELNEESVVRKYRTTAADGKSYTTSYYSLDVIISVGYRVKSHRGTQFRIWATQRIKEYLIKGFTIDDERLKSGNQPNYFQELLDRIRDIRSSEKIFYQRVKDIYATSIDYDPKGEVTQAFFATVQNKLHWAIHKHTAAELIYNRVDSNKVNMGLTTWKSDKIRKGDVVVAKNYLLELELKELNLLVEQYLAFAEAQALAQRPMYMADWSNKLNDILTINHREILLDAGRISKKIADELAEREFEKYSSKQREIETAQGLKELENDLSAIKKGKKKK